MMIRRIPYAAGLALAASLVSSPLSFAQTGPATFTATAAVKTAGGAAATAPVTIVVDRTMPQAEVDKYLAAFKTGGADAVRKLLEGVAPTGSVQIAAGEPTPTRLTLERVTQNGRLLTIVTDKPLLFLGAGMPGARPKAGYDFAVIDLEIDAAGAGHGTLSPAATIKVQGSSFVVSDYGQELVRLSDVKKTK